ncbi:hypothetical protein SAMN05443549_1063 [Flavobacterium fluvii]|uniref:Phage abortive infection protein n=1 Tax=Flavobacterium fluvii TaxID=468056 RepID=A0A1M5M1X1_9FLAO|nr:hypothetical protein [Flavobacterium fluvii]SHG70909.1 hypothetical protein SAMN05443549_1063 [Flavobacterium fluvii]
MDISNWITLSGVVFSALFSGILIWVTFKLGEDQKKLQRDISNQNITFQQEISDLNFKTNLYQYRVNCYLQIIQVLYEINFSRKTLLDILSGKMDVLGLLSKIEENKNVLLKAGYESRILFDKNVADYIEKEIFYNYNLLFEGLTELVLKTNFVDYMTNLNQNHTLEEYFSLLSTHKLKETIISQYPMAKNVFESAENLKNYYISNKLGQQMSQYFDLKNLGKTEI